MSKELVNWNSITEKNITECLKLVKNMDFEQLRLPNIVEDFILTLSSDHHCDAKVLFYVILSAVGHFGEKFNVYNMETKQIKPVSVYEVLIAPSGAEKSKYINIISNACTKYELYLYNYYFKQQRSFVPVISSEEDMKTEEKKNSIKSFDDWVNHYGSIKQVYTTPSLLQIMARTSVFFLANEGDAILQESSFYNPSDVTADIKQGTLIDCWDGNKLVKSTVTHGSREITGRTVSVCLASTGRRWPDLLRELAKVQIAGGLHERCTYFCFDVFDDSGLTQVNPVAEKQFYLTLYDALLSSNPSSRQFNYSLEQLYFVIKLFGNRIFIWSRESFSFMQPRLHELKTNKPCKLVPDTVLFRTKQQMALRRRSAEHVVRYACLIQLLLNALRVLKSIDNNTMEVCAGTIQENFDKEARSVIYDMFGPSTERTESFHANGVPIKPLEIDIDAVTSAVTLVFSLLLPQAVLLFDYEASVEHVLKEPLGMNSTNPPKTKQEKLVVQIEKFILNLKYVFFHKSCITDRHFRDKRHLVDVILGDLVDRRLLHHSYDNKPYFGSGRVSTIQTYLKFLPDRDDEERFRSILWKVYDIDYEQYKENIEEAALLPPKCQLTSYGRDFLQQPQFKSVVNRQDFDHGHSNLAGANIGLSTAQPSSNVAESFTQSIISSPCKRGYDNNRQSSTDDVWHILQDTPDVNLPTHDQNSDTMHDDPSKINGIAADKVLPLEQEPVSIPADDQFEEKDVPRDPNLLSNSDRMRTKSVIVDETSLTDVPSDSLAHSSTIPKPIVQMAADEARSIESSDKTIHDSSPQPSVEQIGYTDAQYVTFRHLFSLSLANETKMPMMHFDQRLCAKILSIRSVLLTKGLITSHIRITTSELKDSLHYLIARELLMIGKYLQCGKRQIDAYLKYVPANLEEKTVKYSLQGRLLEFDIDIDVYIDSVKSIQFFKPSLRPSQLLLSTFSHMPYTQCNIALVFDKRDHNDEERCKEHDEEEPQNHPPSISKKLRKRMKTAHDDK